jgi:hypothetical protein
LNRGSLDAAERAIHDFYYSMHMYTHGAPRLRLFSSFLGEENSQDEQVAELLRTPHAMGAYLNFLMEVHRERYIEQLRRDGELGGSVDAGGDLAEVAAMGLIINADSNEVTKVQPQATPRLDTSRSSDANDGTPATGRRPSLGSAPTGSASKARRGSKVGGGSHGIFSVPMVEVLFPQSYSGLERSDKRDVWNEDIALLKRAVLKWGKNLRGFDTTTMQTVADLAEKLRKAPNGEIDVDELAWLLMIQWAKYMAWYVKRSALRAQWSEKNSVPGKVLIAQERANNVPENSGDPQDPSKERERPVQATAHEKAVASIAKSRKQLRLSSTYLQSLAESIYKPGEGAKLVDPMCLGAFFAHSMAFSSGNTLQVPGVAQQSVD